MELQNKIKNILDAMPDGRIYLVHKVKGEDGNMIACQADFAKKEYAYTYVIGLLCDESEGWSPIFRHVEKEITELISLNDMNYPFIIFADDMENWNLCTFFSDMAEANAYAAK